MNIKGIEFDLYSDIDEMRVEDFTALILNTSELMKLLDVEVDVEQEENDDIKSMVDKILNSADIKFLTSDLPCKIAACILYSDPDKWGTDQKYKLFKKHMTSSQLEEATTFFFTSLMRRVMAKMGIGLPVNNLNSEQDKQ